MGWPEYVSKPVPVYAGDAVKFFEQFELLDDNDDPLDLVADGWGTWAATWRPAPESNQSVALDVDTSNAASGIIRVSATGVKTRQIQDLVSRRDQFGAWDLQAVKAGATRTWLYGRTTHREDVTR